MATISLRSYLEQIRSVVEEECLDEALVHCRRILEQYPQHLETYRLLGTTLLKRGEHEDAIDVFQRLLSADPEDAVAHRGLAVAYAAIGRLPEANRHREQASEIQPYAQTPWAEPIASSDGSNAAGSQRPRLTRAALARIHLRGGLYAPAITYLTSATSSPASRPDLQVLLAEALWRDGRRLEGVRVSREVLSRLPNCVNANAILAESLLVSDQVDEAQRYLAKVQAALLLERKDLLDDTLPASAFNTRGAFPLDEQVTVQALELRHTSAKRANAPESSWFTKMGISAEEPFVEPATLLSEDPDWLAAFQLAGIAPGSRTSAQTEQKIDIQDPPATLQVEPAEDEPTTDAGRVDAGLAAAVGLAGVLVQEASENERQPEQEAEERTMSENESNADSRAIEEPDERKATLAWLEALAARQGVSLDELSSPGEPSTKDVPVEPYPDWLTRDLTDIPTGAELAPPPGAEEISEDDIPHWLRDSVDAPAADASVAVAETESLDDLGWLDQIAAGAGEAIDEPPTLSWQKSGPGAMEDDDALSWLDEHVKPTHAAAVTGLAIAAAAETQSADEVIVPLEQPVTAPESPSDELTGDEAPATVAGFEPAIPEREEAEAAMMTSLDDVPDDLETAQVLLGAAFVGERMAGEGERDQQVDVASQPATELADEVPEDPADVLNWLERLAVQQIAERAAPVPTEPVQVVEEPATPAVALEIAATATAAEALTTREVPNAAEDEIEIDSVENLIASIPDDPDAAMAWLEQLAAQQEAALEELPVAEEQATAAVVPEEAPEPVEDGAALAAVAGLALAEPADDEEAIWPVDVEQEVADAMPDWLALEPAQPVGELQGDLPTAWEADQADFAAWLAGEETARVTEPSLVSGILVEEGAPATGFEELTAAVAPDRAALIAGYERELARGENVADVLQGLKALLAESPEPDPRAARLLGDAYAQAGDYALALETYGSALDML